MNDLISRKWLMECVNEGWIKFDTEKDENKFIHLVRDIAPSAQPSATDTNVATTDTISRAAALEAMDTWDKFGCDPDGKLVRYGDDKHYVPYVHYDDMVYAIEHLPPAQQESIRINLNEKIKVKLTDWGKKIYYHQYDRTNQIVGREICKPRFPKEDENGYTEFQLWCFIELYGEHMGMTLPNVIEPLEIVYER